VASDEKYQKEEISQLISKGKRQGFLSWEEIDQTFAEEVGPEDDFDNFYHLWIVMELRFSIPSKEKYWPFPIKNCSLPAWAGKNNRPGQTISAGDG